MKVEFENGSVIESIGDIENSIRSKRGNDYINNLRKDNNFLFINPEEISSFEPRDLNGKILKIIVTEDENIRLIGGQDIDTGKIYIISYEKK